MDRRGFLVAGAAGVVSLTPDIGDIVEPEEVISSEELAKILSSSPEKRVTAAYQQGNDIQTTWLSECDERSNSTSYSARGTRRAEGGKVWQTSTAISKNVHPYQADPLDCIYTESQTSETTSVLNLDHPDLIAITVAAIVYPPLEQLRYLRCENGWKVVPSSCKLLIMSSSGVSFI